MGWISRALTTIGVWSIGITTCWAAAPATIAGRVVDALGAGVPNAGVTLVRADRAQGQQVSERQADAKRHLH